jgi:HTH-type transcriptional repressor of NAD biosynthesis genes
MTRGLIIGKFLPPHKGHLALIEFAAKQCDKLIVSMSDAADDPIDAALRLSWLKQLTTARVESLRDDFDRPELPLDARTKIWAAAITKAYGKIDKVFSSEEYGEPFAKNLGALHVSFDQSRKNIPVSGSLIRKSPFKYWDFIPKEVQPYFVKRICFYGPESTGKSTAAIRMAQHYNTVSVPEVARELLTTNNFTVDDIILIGKAQTQRVLEYTKLANKLLFCDTDLIVTQIYSQHYLGVVPDILHQLEKQLKYDQYFFCDIDMPWIEDGLRDLGHMRQDMRRVFMEELTKRGIDFTLLQGSFEQRERLIMQVLDKLFFDYPFLLT